MTESAAGALVIGEALIDIVTGARPHGEYIGGSPANVAVGVARLGHAVDLLTCLGRDARGERISAHFADEAVRLLPESWSAESTSTAVADIADDGSAQYTFDLHWSIPAFTPPPADLVHTGSIGLFADPGGREVLRQLRESSSSLITLDPNVRPDLVGEHAAALARFEEAVGLCDLVKLSDEDAAWLYPGADPHDVAAHIAALGPRLVAITLGADGALGWSAEATVRVPAVVVEVADTISAGDSFMASLIADLLDRGLDAVEGSWREVLTRAACAAAIAVSWPGAHPPTRAELATALSR